MSNIVPFNAEAGQMMSPEDMAKIFGESNITAGEAVPAISIKGKVWTIVKDGNETPIMVKTEDGDFPVQSLKVIVVNQTLNRTRTFFDGPYVEGENRQPDCMSFDGKYPASDVANPVSPTCDSCPNAVKGSKITENGTATTACSVGKLLAVIPSSQLDHQILRLKLPVTSLYDKENGEEAQGWYAWDQYVRFLRSRQVTHTGAVETTMKFDSSAPYPKILFKTSGMVDLAGAKTIAARVDSDEVNHILGLDKVRSEPAVVVETKVEEKSVETKPAATVSVAPAEEKTQTVDTSNFGGSVETKASEEKVAEQPKPEPVKTVVDTDEDLAAALANW